MNSPDTGRERYRVGGLTVDVGTRSVMRAGEHVSLPKRSFELLLALVRSAPDVLETDQLIEEVWHGAVVSPETITQRIKLLRQAIGDDARDPKYVALVRGQGYRLIADVDLVSGEDNHTASPANKRALVWGAAATVAVLLVSYLIGNQRSDAPGIDSTALPETSIAVLPLANLGDPEDEVFSKGIPDTILNKLGNIDDLIVIARTSSFAYADSDLNATEIGQELGARYLLEGSVLSSDDALRISARLVDTVDSSYAWSIERDMSIGDVFEVQDEIVLEIVDALKLTLQDESRARILTHGTESIPAYLAYQRGRSENDGQSLRGAYEAESYFREALALDPEYARAWLGLAEAGQVRQIYGDLDAEGAAQLVYDHATRALEFDPGLGEAYAVMARRNFSPLTMTTDPDHISEAIEMINKATELSPGHPGIMRLQAGLTCPSAFRDKTCNTTKARLYRDALRRDPESSPIYTSLASVLVELSNKNAAIATLNEALRRSPEYPYGNWMLAWMYWEIGEPDWPKAAACLASGIRSDPGNMILRASTAAMDYDLGRIAAARQTTENIDNQHGAYDSWLRYLQFVDHLRNGELDQARQLAWQVVPQIAPYGGQSEIAYSVLADDALASGKIDVAITLLESQLEITQTMFRQFEDGLVRGRSSAFVALALARLYFASGMDDKAEALVSASREMFEREIADSSPWAAPNTNAYALSLLLSGERDLALQALGKLPDTYLRRTWYLESNPAFESLRDEPEFQETVRRIDERIREFREAIESDAADSVSCLPQAAL